MVLVIPCHGNPTMMKIDQNGENYRKCSLDICSVYLHFFFMCSALRQNLTCSQVLKELKMVDVVYTLW